MAQQTFEDLAEAVKQAESRGKRYAEDGKTLTTSAKGALGEMQVMPKTIRDPGFGVTPARDKSPDEIARVGKDYLQAMLNKYGDMEKALVAYNWGPRSTDEWIASGAKPEALPAETKTYIKRVKGFLGQDVSRETKLAASGPKPVKPRDPIPASLPPMASLGANYQAAMAVSMLADEAEKEGKGEDEPSESEKFFRQQEAEAASLEKPALVASLDLGYQSPFPEVEQAQERGRRPRSLIAPIRLAEGGEARKMLDELPVEGEVSLSEVTNTGTLKAPDVPVSRSAKQLKAYTEALNPAVKVLTNDLGGGVRGSMFPSMPDMVRLDSSLSPGEREITLLHEVEHSMDAKGGDLYGRPKFALMGGMDNNYRAYYLMGGRWDSIAETVKNMVDNREKLEKFFGRPLDNAYFQKQVYDSLEKKNNETGLFSEQLASLSALEQTTGKFLTQDPEMRKLFPNYKMMAVYDALTGPRQTRMDARDLPPHTPVPSYTYSQNPVSRALIKTFTGKNEYGPPYRPFPIKRAEGSPETGEVVSRLTPQETERIAARETAEREAASTPAFIAQKSGIGRKAGNISKALASGEAYPAIARGVAETPFNLVGGFADIGNLALMPFGLDVKEPMLGSAQLKRLALERGIRYPEETDPTLQGFRTAGELGASLVNPAAPVRATVQTAQKAGGKAADMLGSFKKTKEAPTSEFQNYGQLAPSPPAIISQAPVAQAMPTIAPVAQPVTQVQAAARAPISAEFPFVGRLDTYVSELKNPVQKEQFINQVKNKFRDYDVERVREALVDFGDKDKLQPEQIKAAIAKVYSPSNLRVEERGIGSSGLYNTMDNVYDQPMGAVNMYLKQPPEKAEIGKRVNQLEKDLIALYNGNLAPEKIAELKNIIDNDSVISTLPTAKEVSQALTHVEKSYKSIANAKKELMQISNGYLAPPLYTENGTSPFFDLATTSEIEILKAKGIPMNSKNPMYDFTVARRNLPDMERKELERQGRIEATKEVIRRANERSVKLGGDPVDTRYLDFSMVDQPYDVISLNPTLKNQVESALEPIQLQILDGTTRIKRYLSKSNRFDEELAPYKLYEGEHPTVASDAYPVGFARFTEHEVNVPGYGTLQGRHFHDFQSDLAQDVRKTGPKGRTLEKDKAEYDKLVAEQAAGMAEPPANMPDAEKIKLALEMVKRDKRISELGARLRSPTTSYSLEQPFANFETSPAVEQQLLMKNAIQATMRSGKNFITFPGAESMQAGLYEKIPNNLKQVVKDMGTSGLEIRSIELPPTTRELINNKGQVTHPLGKPLTAYGLIWSPEAAQRIIQGGVSFAKGGMVERQSADTRRYL